MTDIVDRLRERSGEYDEYAWHSDIELEAADEIERLREAIREWGEAIVQAEGVLFTGGLKHQALIEGLVDDKGYC